MRGPCQYTKCTHNRTCTKFVQDCFQQSARNKPSLSSQDTHLLHYYTRPLPYRPLPVRKCREIRWKWSLYKLQQSDIKLAPLVNRGCSAKEFKRTSDIGVVFIFRQGSASCARGILLQTKPKGLEIYYVFSTISVQANLASGLDSD